MPREGWKEYFAFSKKQRKAVFILLAIMAVFIFFTFFYTPVFTSPVIDKNIQQKLTALSSGRKDTSAGIADDTDAQPDSSEHTTAFYNSNVVKKEQFYFDPNTLSIDGWKRLGFRDKTIENIMHYRDEVGKFNTAEDLYNVPRIRKKAVEAILPFVRFGAVDSTKYSTENSAPPGAPIAENSKGGTYKTININTATAADFKTFPGITDPIANRIIKFRSSLNGFNSVDDVAKTYGLPNTTFKAMRPYLTITPK